MDKLLLLLLLPGVFISIDANGDDFISLFDVKTIDVFSILFVRTSISLLACTLDCSTALTICVIDKRGATKGSDDGGGGINIGCKLQVSSNFVEFIMLLELVAPRSMVKSASKIIVAFVFELCDGGGGGRVDATFLVSLAGLGGIGGGPRDTLVVFGAGRIGCDDDDDDDGGGGGRCGACGLDIDGLG